MTLFNTTKTKNTLPALTAVKAQEIYESLKTRDANTLFLEDNIPTEYTEVVMAEMKKLEAEMVSKMKGSYVTVEEVSHLDENGEKVIDTAKEYFSVTTETALKASMSSDILDIPTLVEDVRQYSDNNPDSSPLWDVYKNSFTEE